VAQGGQRTGSVHFGTFDLDLQSGELRKHGLKIRLPNQSFQILARLLERSGEVVSREELRQILWTDDTFVDFEVGLSSAVKKLRDALGDSAENSRFVETLPKRGYRFIAPVVRTHDGPNTGAPNRIDTPALEVAADEGSTASVVESLDDRQGSRLRASKIAAILLAGFAGLAIVGFAAVRHRNAGDAKPPSIRSIAVLPLANLTGDPGQEYFVDGMTDNLITELAQISDVRVISRTSVMRYKEARTPTPVVGQELNVDAIVEGTVVRSGPRVRINAQLIDAQNDRHMWAHSYERDANDIAALQSDVAQAIAEAVAGTVAPGRQRYVASRRVSEEANMLFFKATIAAGAQNYQGFKDGISYAEAAIAKQPDFAASYGAIAIWYVQFSFVGPLSPVEFMPKAEAAARKAIALDEMTSQAHGALGLVLFRFHWDWEGAEKEFRRALQINPSYADGHRMFGAFLSAAGRTSEGLEELEEAQKLDPLSTQALLNLATANYEAGQNERAILELQTAIEKSPQLGRAHAQLGEAYLAQGDLDASIRELRTAITLSGRNLRILAHLGYADAVTGNTTEAQNILRELDALSHERFVSPLDMAGIHAGLGQTEAALMSLEKAYKVHDPQMSKLLVDKRMDRLRSDDRFQALERRVGLHSARWRASGRASGDGRQGR
jgi:TolB-like protein/DNA-binding winged helix-turn-helix (wHTH) protein/Tfp pilus assembly protein PilF